MKLRQNQSKSKRDNDSNGDEERNVVEQLQQMKTVSQLEWDSSGCIWTIFGADRFFRFNFVFVHGLVKKFFLW